MNTKAQGDGGAGAKNIAKHSLASGLLLGATPFALAGAVNDGMTGWFWAVPFLFILLFGMVLPFLHFYQRIYSALVLALCVYLNVTLTTNPLIYPVIGKVAVSVRPFDVIRYDRKNVIGDNSVPAFEDEHLRSHYAPRENGMGGFPKPEFRETVPQGQTLKVFKVEKEESPDSSGVLSIYFRNDRFSFRVERESFPEFRGYLKEGDWLTERALCQKWFIASLADLMYYPLVFIGRIPPIGICSFRNPRSAGYQAGDG